MALLIDTSVLAALDRAGLPLVSLAPVLGDEDLHLCGIVVAELLLGVELARTDAQRMRRTVFVDGLIHDLPVVAFGMAEARTHAILAAQLRRLGTPIGAHDLLIAATALTHNVGVATANAADFERVPGLRVTRVRVDRP